jgi:hypothetical protein
VDVNEDGVFQPDERIFIDTTGHGVGTQRSSSDPAYGNGLYLGGVPLIAGHNYRFRFEQTEGGGGAGARAFWQSPRTPNQIIPLPSTRAFEIPDLVAPTVTATTVNGHIPSTATYTPNFHITFKFSEPVTSVEDTDFQIETVLGFLDSTAFDVTYDAASQTAILTFPDLANQRLPDGDGVIHILNNRIFDTFGNSLDGDNNGSPGGEAVIPFYVFTGDTQMAFNGSPRKDRRIDFVDYQIMSRNFGMTNPSGADGDVNLDGVINNDDFLYIRQHFGETLPGPAPVPTPPAPTPAPVNPTPTPTPTPRPKPLPPKPVAVAVTKPVTPTRPTLTTGTTPSRAAAGVFATRKLRDMDWLAS